MWLNMFLLLFISDILASLSCWYFNGISILQNYAKVSQNQLSSSGYIQIFIQMAPGYNCSDWGAGRTCIINLLRNVIKLNDV